MNRKFSINDGLHFANPLRYSNSRWFYRYDPFGRRTGKRCEQTQDDIRYLWDGDQIAEVRHYRNGELIARRHWVHNG